MNNFNAIRYSCLSGRQALSAMLSGLFFIFTLSGCIVRTYPLVKERVDQDLSAGNRGYLKGGSSFAETKERKLTRTTQAVEIELRSPFKFEKTKSQKIISPQGTETYLSSEINKEYISENIVSELTGPAVKNELALQKYTVEKNDTLQKISKKFYGTTKKWTKIYEANKDILKGPNKIYPGQTINIPVEQIKEPLKEPSENLK